MDNNVDTVSISQNDRFYFSCLYDEAVVKPLLRECQVSYTSYKDIPVLPLFASELEVELIRRSIFGTAALEGNPSSEEDVKKILARDEKEQSLSNTDMEISNLNAAYKALRKSQLDKIDIDEKLIKIFHKLITLNIENDNNQPGKYRLGPCKVGNKEHGGTYVPPKTKKDIELLMKYFIEWFNTEKVSSLDPIIRGLIAHYYLGLIHPFGDGNGRTARVIEAGIMITGGMKNAPFMLANYYYQHIDEYYWAFSLARKNKDKDITDFIRFGLTGLLESTKTIKTKVVGAITMLLLKDFYNYLHTSRHITQRQFDLLQLLVGTNPTFTFNDLLHVQPFELLYRNVSERTARRDLSKLTVLNVLAREGEKYSLNVSVLPTLS